MKIRFLAPLILASVFLPGSVAFAHHGNAAYDSGKSITLKGTVTEWWWANPHCLLMFDVKGDNGEVAHWITETQAPINMIPSGWSKDSFKAGDEVMIDVEPAKSGKPIGRIESVVLPNGKKLIGQTQKQLQNKDAEEGHK
jgi:hypothetical protein